MSFTQDELQILHAIVEQRLNVHRRELERLFDQRLGLLKHEFEQRLSQTQQDIRRSFMRGLKDQQATLNEAFRQSLANHQVHTTQSLQHHLFLQDKQQQHYEDLIERSLAAQLLAFEQLMNQRIAIPSEDSTISEVPAGFDAIEVQTEIPWNELADLIDHALDERISSLVERLLATVKDTESALVAQIDSLREILQSSSPSGDENEF